MYHFVYTVNGCETLAAVAPQPSGPPAVCVGVSVCGCGCVWVGVGVCGCVCGYVWVCMYLCVCMCMYVCLSVCVMYVCVYVRMCA